MGTQIRKEVTGEDTRHRSTKTLNGRGQNGLYWKLVRSVAEKEAESRAGDGKQVEFDEVLRQVDFMFNLLFSSKSPYPDMPEFRVIIPHKTLSVTDFKTYYDHCQRAAIRQWGVSGMDEDKLPFHEQPKQ